MEELLKFMIERKDALRLSFIEQECGMSKQSLKLGNPIPEKYFSKLLEVLEKYYGYTSKSMEISKNMEMGISTSMENPYNEPLDFYLVPEGKVVYKGQDGIIKTRLGSGQWKRVVIPHLFIVLRVKDSIMSGYVDDTVGKMVAKGGRSEEVIELPEGMGERDQVR